MYQFADSSGQSWLVTPFTVGRLREIKLTLGVDLLSPNCGWVQTLVVDAEKLLAFVMACVAPAPESGAPCYDHWTGRDIDIALTRVIEALADFFQPAQGRVIRLAWKTVNDTAAQLTDAELLATTSPGGPGSTRPPGDSGSTPNP